ncbi:coiled-coil domain-containing protein 13 [Halyomorpha halys]|uniref:coiled-coil domain-containing protein 13 n=1 Tax=Halyomorpha halys TaxID=286706 RepID=UPI0006D4F03A|nr:coiled-coil domain-containing protein 13-like [Halyomorpha halys]
MSLLKKLSDKLDAILNEEEAEDETLQSHSENTDARNQKKQKSKPIVQHDEWEDENDISFLNVGKNIKIKKPKEDPLFPNDVTVPETFTRKSKLKSKPIKDVDKSEDKLDELQINPQALPPVLRELESSEGFVEAKMVELSKKIRELNAQLATTQNKLKIAESRVVSQESIQKESIVPKEVSEDKITQLEVELKDLNDKYHACNTKLCETRNQVQQYKHEIKLLHKALASEIGDNFSIHTVTSEGWRGRAQQICSLQQKVFDLNEKLSLTSIPSIEKSVSAVQSFEKSQDKERIASLTKELEELKFQLSETKNKGDQARARVNVLSADISVLRTKYETLVSKNDEDNKLINTLTNKLGNLSQKNHEKELHMVKAHDDQLAVLNTELKQERVKTDQLQKIVTERDAKITKLEEKLHNCQQQECQLNAQIKNDGFIFRPETSSTGSERPVTQQSVSTSPSYSQSIEIERLRLMELITVLNKRLDEERKNLDKVQDQLRVEKQKTAKLESKVNKLELERVGRNYRRPTARPESLSKFELENMKDHCALLKEKCLALESRLERLRHEKEEDNRIFVRMVEEARAALRDQIRKSNSYSASS